MITYGENDKVTVRDAYRYYYGEGKFMIEEVEFADGTKYGLSEIANMANHLDGGEGDDYIVGFEGTIGYNQSEVIHGYEGNDSLSGNNGDDTIYGDEGNDGLHGGNGNDTLIGGTGNDYMEGGDHNDTYVFNLGDGEDTIYDFHDSFDEGRADRILFGEGISVEDVKLERSGNNLVITYSENDKVTVADAYRYYYGEGKFEVEKIEFHDGTQADVNYQNQSLDITFVPEVEENEEESFINDMADVISDVLNPESVITDYEENYDSETDSYAAITSSDVDLNKMADLLVQEMSDIDEGGIANFDLVADNENTSDELLWAE